MLVDLFRAEHSLCFSAGFRPQLFFFSVFDTPLLTFILKEVAMIYEARRPAYSIIATSDATSAASEDRQAYVQHPRFSVKDDVVVNISVPGRHSSECVF